MRYLRIQIIGYYAMITIMTDNLIQINETYGRNNGDRYIQNIANLIRDFGIKKSIAARKGGGEFILFIYGYENEHELLKALNILLTFHSFPEACV